MQIVFIVSRNSMTSRKLLDVSELKNLERYKNVDPCLWAKNSSDVEEEIETYQATEMSMLCLKCDNYIDLAHLPDHRSFHDALSLFQYDNQTKPTNEKALNCQRVALVKGLNEMLNPSRSAYHKELSKIDLAYEILKSELNGRLNITRSLYSSGQVEVTVKSFKTKLCRGLSLGVCQSANEKWKSAMEDAHSFVGDYITGMNSGFFAVYDGYNGQTAARKCACQLHVILKEKLSELNTFEECCEKGDCKFSTWFQQTYDEIDKMLILGDNETSRNRWSGCSATTCVMCGGHLHVANVGNVKGILFKGDGTIQTLTEDHIPSNKKEKRRIKWNGDIQKWSKTTWVNGITMTTRGLGNHGDLNLKLNVINIPAFSCVPVDADDKIILIGSGGFWEVFGEEEVNMLIKDWLKRKVNEIVEGNDVVGSERENKSMYSDDFNGINDDGEHENTLSLSEETKIEIQLPNQNRQPIVKEEEYKVHPDDDNDEEYNNNISVFPGSSLQNTLIEGKRCERDENDCESAKTNDVFNKTSFGNLHHTTLTKLPTKRLLSGLLEDFSEQEDCKIAVEMSKHLVRAALSGGAKDNVTVMVILLTRN